MSYKVFISFKNLTENGKPTRDSEIAKKLYDMLKNKGVETFFSNEEVERKHRPDYGDLIDEALESAQVLLLVGSSRENIDSRWVKYEWNTFKNEINSGRKNGYIIPVLENMDVGDLPISLRTGQIYTAKEAAKAVEMTVGITGGTASIPGTKKENTIGRYSYSARMRIAAETGSAQAQYAVANCYMNGDGVELDRETAVKWYRKAAANGHVDAQYCMGYCYECGEGVGRDIDRARVWYELASNNGSGAANDALRMLPKKSVKSKYVCLACGYEAGNDVLTKCPLCHSDYRWLKEKK